MDIHARLKWAREQRGYASAREAAEAIGVRYSTYAGHESGSRGIKREALRRYARFFRVSPAWLEFGGGAQAETDIDRNKRILENTEEIKKKLPPTMQFVSSSLAESARAAGFIQAGIWVDPSVVLEAAPTAEFPWSIAAKWSGLPQFFYVTRDNSADQLRILAGDYVLCVPYESARGGQLQDKDIVVIERVRDRGAFERTVKQIVLQDERCSLISRSSEPRFPSIDINAQTMMEEDGTLIRIVGLAIAVCVPLGTD